MKDSSMRFKDPISAEGHYISFNLWRVKSFAFTVQKTISNTKVGGNDDVHSLKQLIFSHAYNPMHRYLYEEVKLGCTFRWNSITTNSTCLKPEMNKSPISVLFFEHSSKHNRKHLVLILKKSNETYENDAWLTGYNASKRWKVAGNSFLLLRILYFGLWRLCGTHWCQLLGNEFANESCKALPVFRCQQKLNAANELSDNKPDIV